MLCSLVVQMLVVVVAHHGLELDAEALLAKIVEADGPLDAFLERLPSRAFFAAMAACRASMLMLVLLAR